MIDIGPNLKEVVDKIIFCVFLWGFTKSIFPMVIGYTTLRRKHNDYI